MKYFEPHNRHLWIQLIDTKEEEDESAVLLPHSYKPKQNEFCLVQVKGFAPDCQNMWKRGDKIVVEERMIREIKMGKKTFYAILENYILGIIK